MTNTRYLNRQIANIDNVERQASTYRKMTEAVRQLGTDETVTIEAERFLRLADEMDGAAEEWRAELLELFTVEQIEAATG